MPTKVTDPALLAQLNGAAPARQKVTDPALLAQLNGTEAPDAADDPQARYDAALQAVREKILPDLTDDQWKRAVSTSFAPYNVTDLAQNGSLFGFADEGAAGLSALTDQVRKAFTGQGPNFGEAYQLYQTLNAARRDLGRKNLGWVAPVAEVVGGLGTAGGPAAKALVEGGSAAVNLLKSAASGGIQGAAYGFGDTDGSLADRLQGAKAGGVVGIGVGGAASTLGKTIEGVAARRVAKQASEAAPAAAAIKGVASQGYDAARASNAVIDTPALGLLQHDIGSMADLEGLLFPSGKVVNGYPKVKGALKALNEYTKGPMTVSKLLTLRKTFGKVASSSDDQEARFGSMLLDQLDNWAEGLPQQAFKAGNGEQAMQALSDARETYARAMRAGTIEKAIYHAKLDGGGEAALRGQFKTILKSDKERRGFTPDEIAAMEKFVIGGGAGDFLRSLSAGRGLSGLGFGSLAGGPVGAVAVPVAGMAAKAGIDANARAGADALRALVANRGQVAPAEALSLAGLNRLAIGGSNPLMQDDRKYLMDLLPR